MSNSSYYSVVADHSNIYGLFSTRLIKMHLLTSIRSTNIPGCSFSWLIFLLTFFMIPNTYIPPQKSPSQSSSSLSLKPPTTLTLPQNNGSYIIIQHGNKRIQPPTNPIPQSIPRIRWANNHRSIHQLQSTPRIPPHANVCRSIPRRCEYIGSTLDGSLSSETEFVSIGSACVDEWRYAEGGVGAWTMGGWF